MKGIKKNMLANEDFRDIVTLIDVVALDRARARRESPSRTHFEFAGKVWCVLFDPFKPPHFRNQATARRLGFAGVASSPHLQQEMRKSIKDYLRTVDNE